MKHSEISLRNWEESDIHTLAKHANNSNIAQFMTDTFPHPYGIENAINFINMTMNITTSKFKAIDLNGEIIGGIGIHPQVDIQRKNAELGYWLSQEHWNKGYMTQCVKEMIDYTFNNLDIHRIFGNTFGNNESSKKVLLNSGMKQEAIIKDGFFKNNQYFDTCIFSILKPDWIKQKQ